MNRKYNQWISYGIMTCMIFGLMQPMSTVRAESMEKSVHSDNIIEEISYNNDEAEINGYEMISDILVEDTIEQNENLIEDENVNRTYLEVESQEKANSMYEPDVEKPVDDYRDENLIGELENLRDEASRQFLMADGSVTLAEYETDVNYLDENGNWAAIDNTLYLDKNSHGESVYTNKAGRIDYDFDVDSRSGSLVSAEQGEHRLSFSVLDAGKETEDICLITEDGASAVDDGSLPDLLEAEHIRSAVRYSGIFPGTDLEYILEGSSLKENIVIYEPQDEYVYRFRIDADNVKIFQDKEGGLVFAAADTGDILYTMPALYMWDAEGRESCNVACEIREEKDGIVLIVCADPGWINDLERAWPVTIDPTLQASSTSTGADSRIVRNQYVSSGHPTLTSAGYGRGYLGYDSSGDRIYRMFVQFRRLPSIPASCVIGAAKFYYAQASYGHSGMSTLTVAAKEVTENWNWGTGVNWNTQPSFDDTILDYQILSASTTGTYVGWDITKLVKTHYEDKNNAGTDTSSFVLVGMDEDGYSASHCAKADVIQENSAGYFSSAQPVLLIAYRDAIGLEGYYTAREQDLGNAGTAYISDYKKALTVARDDVASDSAAMPFGISHVYNSDWGEKYFDTASGIDTRSYGNMVMGLGWKLSIQETIVEKRIGTTDFLIYNDGDGTDHYFPKESGSTYKDEDGLKLTVVKSTSPLKYTMTDEKGNKRIFYNGYLATVMDANGNAVHIVYNGAAYTASGTWYAGTGSTNRITSIVRVNKDKPQVTIATLSYNSAKCLTKITDQYGRQTKYAYTQAPDGNGGTLGYQLTKITDPDGTYAEYMYYDLDNYRSSKMARTRDSRTGLGGRYTYRTTKHSSRISGYEDIHWTSPDAYARDHVVQVENRDILQTVYKDPGIDGTAGNDDDIYTRYVFDNAGRTVSIVSTDRQEGTIYGASSAAYTAGNSSKKANRVMSDAVTGMAGINRMKNGSVESGSGEMPSYWSGIKRINSSASAHMVLSIENGTENVRSGSRSLKVHLDSSGAVADSNGNITGEFRNSVSLTAGKTYTFSGYFRNTDPDSFDGTGKAYLEIRNSSGTTVARGPALREATSEAIEGGWSRLCVTFTPVSSGTYTLAACADKIYGDSYFDDFQLEEGECASSYNHLLSGSIEWLGNWSLGTGVSQVLSDIEGDWMLQIEGDPSAKRSASIRIPLNIDSKNTFILSGWGHARSVSDLNREESTGRNFGMEAELFYGDGTSEKHFVSFDNSSDSLQYASGNIVPKKDNQTITHAIIRCIYGKNANTACFDNISFRKEPVACYTYDDDGNVVAVRQNGVSGIAMSYQAGNLVQEQDGTNGTYTYTYDDKHNLTKASNDGVDLELTYDNSGHVTLSKVISAADTSARRIETSATYTADGDHLASQKNDAGKTTYYAYNAYGLTSGVTDAAGNMTSYSYDTANGRLTDTALADGTGLHYNYNNGVLEQIVRGSLVPDLSGQESETAQEQQSYNFTHDVYGNVSSVRVGNRLLASYTYLPKNGPLSRITYGNGNTVEYTYDPLGRIRLEKRDGVFRYHYVYGCEGNLDHREEWNDAGETVGIVYYEYDSLGRLIRSWEDKHDEEDSEYRSVSTQHIYDTAGRLSGQSWKTEKGTQKTEGYNYRSSDGSLTQMTTAAGRNLTFSYDHLKRLASRSNGSRSVDYTYKNAGSGKTCMRIGSMTWTGEGSGNISLGYAYDNLGNITEIREDDALVARYQYDSQSQMTREELPAEGITSDYIYDTAGNIRKAVVTENGVVTAHNYSYGDSEWKDLLTAYDGHTITYDVIGNPLQYYNGREWNLSWTDGRHLASAQSNDTTVFYTYDADGMRTSKTVNGVKHEYVYLGELLVEETWGNNILEFAYDEQHHPYAVRYNHNTLYYYVTNQQGDVLRVITGGGELRAEYTYNAWGEIISSSGSFADKNPLRYRGYVYDSETELYYLGSRYYDVIIKRFVNEDDLIMIFEECDRVIDSDQYAYCLNNPVNFIDFKGYSATALIRIGAEASLRGTGLSLSALAGAITPTGWVLIGVVIIGGIVYAKTKSKYNPDPYKRPDQKKQGRELKGENRQKKDYKPRNNKPAQPKHHTPSKREHLKYKK